MLKETYTLIFTVLICAFLSGCASSDSPSLSDLAVDKTTESDRWDSQEIKNTDASDSQTLQEMESIVAAFDGTDNDANLKESTGDNAQENLEQNMEDGTMYIKIGEHTLTAKMADNSSAQALLEKLKDGDITVDAHDFSNFEKVGDLGFSLPTNNEQITTQAGDLILYQGRNFVLYYDTNSWNFTRLGKVEGVTQDELKQILGKGDVTLVLSLNE